MPNHVTTILLVTPEVADGLTRNYTEEEIAENRRQHAATKARVEARGETYNYPLEDMSGRIVDFNLVIPEPDNIFHGGCNGQHPHINEDGVVLVCWYEWCPKNWGTKWNAYDHSVEPQPDDLCEVRFDTAWAHPYPVIEALSAKFPDEIIEVKYADEDFGSNCGRYKIKGGKPFDEFFPEYGEESRRLAADIKYGQTLEEVEAEWERDEIDAAQRAAFCKQIEAERDIDNGYKVMRDEGLEVPDDIKAAISTVEQAEAYWEKENA